MGYVRGSNRVTYTERILHMSSRKNTLLSFVLITLITISFLSLVGCNNQNPTKEKSSISEKKIKEEYDLQERCGKETREFFAKKYRNGYIRYSNGEYWYKYQNHYNKKMNKCLIIITETGKYDKRKELFDFNENKELGWFWYLFVNKEWITNRCEVFEKECTSEEEWDSLVKPYMEE